MLTGRLGRFVLQQTLRRNKTSIKHRPCKGDAAKEPNFFRNKNVVYVGGIGTIGYACCPQLIAQEIRNLIVVDVVSNSNIIELYKSINRECAVSYLRLDLAAGPGPMKNTVDDIESIMGPIDILINGSGVINECNPRLALQTNLLGVMQFTLAANKLMSKSQRGRGGIVVNIASVLGLEPGPFIAVFTAAQHGLIGFTRSLANDYYYNHTKVAHIAICPGFTASEMLEKFDNTFDYATPLSNKLNEMNFQSPKNLVKLMVPTIAQAKNGSIWIIDDGKASEIVLDTYLKSKMEVFVRKQLKDTLKTKPQVLQK